MAGTKQSKIQSLVDNANEGDIVKVPNGKYNETVVVNKRNLTLTKAEGGKCILDGKGELDTAFTVEKEGVSLSGFVVKNYSIGVKIMAPKTWIDNLKLENNYLDFTTATHESVSISNCEGSNK